MKIAVRRYSLSPKNIKINKYQWKKDGENMEQDGTLTLKIKDHDIYADLIEKVPSEKCKKVDNERCEIQYVLLDIEDGYATKVESKSEIIKHDLFNKWH